MNKIVKLFALYLTFVSYTSCKETNKKDLSKDSIKSETKDMITSQVPNSMVRNVKQDRNGNILIASYKGLFRYDGKSFTNLTTKINSPSFWDVLEDKKGNLWVATRDSGVYYYNGRSFEHFTTKEGLANNRVTSIFEDKAGNIWFATGGGASRYDGKSFQNFTTKDGLSDNDLTTIMQDRTGKLWFGTRGKTCFYDGKTFTVLKNKDGKTFNNVWSIIEDKKGNIWFGANGLWRYDGTTFTKVSEKGASVILQDKKGNIWTTGSVNPLGGKVWSLSRYDEKSIYNNKKLIATEIMSINGTGMLCGILEANDGSIWFGSSGSMSGVYRYDGKTITDFRNKKG